MVFLPLPINPMKKGAMPHTQNKFHECNLEERADPPLFWNADADAHADLPAETRTYSRCSALSEAPS